MMKVIGLVLVMFLSINVGVLYYIVLFGDVPEFSRRLEVIERRVDSLVQRDKTSVPQAQAVSEGNLMLLSEQQKVEIAELVKQQIQEQLNSMVSEAEIKLKNEVQAAGSVTKEFFIPIGRASVKTSDFQWKEVPVEVEFDRANYGNVKQITWEATLKVPTGNGQVSARLVDSRSGVVGESELVGEGVEGSYVKSKNLGLAAGRRLLKLQMRTSLDYEGVVENARLRVVVE